MNPQSMPLGGVYTYTYAPPPLAQPPSVPISSVPVSGASPVDPMIVPDLDDPQEQEKLKSRGPVTAEDTEAQQKYNLLEERIRVIEGVKILGAMEASELSLVLGVVIPPKFKVPDFDKYDGTKCPTTHITMYCQKTSQHTDNDKLLIHRFQDNLTRDAAQWYVELDHNHIQSWKDLAKAFIAQYQHVTNTTPNRLTLQNMEKKETETFKEYAQIWRSTTTKVKPPLTDKEVTMTFINTLKGHYYDKLMGNATRNFVDLVISGEMVEIAIKSGKVDMLHDNHNQRKGGNSKKKKGNLKLFFTRTKQVRVMLHSQITLIKAQILPRSK